MYISFIIIVIAFVCYTAFSLRLKSVIIVSVEETLADASHIITRGEIWVKNNPGRTIDEYMAAHISEQLPDPMWIKKTWELQRAVS